MPPKNAAGAKRNALKKLDPMDELTGALAELQKIQDSLDFLDIDPEDESFDWNKLNLQGDIVSIMKVMDQASGALDEVERRTDRLNAKLDAMLAEGEEAAKRLAELKAKGAAEGKDSSEDKKEDNEDASATIEETEAGKGPDDDKEAV